MSGPKVVRYNMNSFSAQLKEFLRRQAYLEHLQIEMQKAELHDETYNIHYDCNKDYEKIKEEINKALIAMVFDYKGSFNRQTYDKINNKINRRTQKLNEVISKSEQIIDNFKSKEKDYNSYVDYNLFMKNAKESLDKFQTDIGKDTKKNFAKNNEKLVEETLKKYGSIEFEKETVDFKWGFSKVVEKEKEKVVSHLLDKETAIKEVRKELVDRLIATSSKKFDAADKLKLSKPNEEINRISKKITLLINSCKDKHMKTGYNDQFNQLQQSDSMNDVFFYQELHDRVLECEESRKNKLRLKELLITLNESSFDKSLETEKKGLAEKVLRQINDSKVSDKELDILQRKKESLNKKNQQIEIEKEIRKKEQQFIKTQIIHELESKGYEVLEDLEVIDFEKETDFHLQAPGQENLLNLKFKDDGSFRYVFQIPEKKASLSIDQQKMKLHEMKTTCDDFVEVLEDLKEMGVRIDIAQDKPIEMESIITIPEKLNEKLKAGKSQTRRKQQIKKLYLDNNGN